MADIIDLTDGVKRVTAINTVQPLAESVDVSGYDTADLLLWVAGLEGTFTGGGFQVAIITGMSKDTEDGWVTMASFTSTTSSNFAEKKGFSGPLRYIRWKVISFTGGTAAIFQISGMLRVN